MGFSLQLGFFKGDDQISLNDAFPVVRSCEVMIKQGLGLKDTDLGGN